MDFEYILKSKPEAMSTDEYIFHIQNQLKNPETSDDFAMTVCSDDFEFDEENTQINDTKVDFNTNNDVNSVINLDDSNDSMTILQNLNVRNFEDSVAMVDETESVFDVLREIERNSQDVDQHTITIPSNFSQTFYESLTQSFPNNDMTSNEAYENNEITNIKLNENINNNQQENNLVDLNKNDNTVSNINVDTEATQFYTVPDYTQNFTHVSQSQDNMIIAQKFIKSKTKNAEIDSTIIIMDEENDIINQNEQINDLYTQDITVDDIMYNNDLSVTNNVNFNNFEKAVNINTERNLNKTHNSMINAPEVTDINSKKVYVDNVTKSNVTKECKSKENNAKELNDKDTQYTLQTNKDTLVLEDINGYINGPDKKNAIVCTDITTELNNEEIESETEVVPFKVIEELSKIKQYLAKNTRNCDGSDSGYRSSSQISLTSSGVSGSGPAAWVNQSAHSLFDYITRCPLVSNTQEITGEISEILGGVIDKLHEEEKYPIFFEELLENVIFLLEELYKRESDEFVLIKKDEYIQRICLLNKSCHILKFTIEKITNILEKLHDKLTNKESLLEITDIDQIENASYIIHLLNILLKRYLKVKDSFSQSSQSSQEDKLKRSSITEVWRRKWNPKYDVAVNEGSFEKECVLPKCCIVLNKIIVDCMNGYSLIAFAALQCFNLIQI